MKVVIFGLSKSGTTALFYRLKDSLPDLVYSVVNQGPRHLRNQYLLVVLVFAMRLAGCE